MKIFVIGYSRTGKTPLAKMLADTLGFEHISGSVWIKQALKESDFEGMSKQEAIDYMTSESMRYLKANPDTAANVLVSQVAYFGGENTIVEGLRNPRDFRALYDSREDVVIYLEREGFGPATDFERLGVEAIRAGLAFDILIDESLRDRVMKASWDKRPGLDEVHDLVIQELIRLGLYNADTSEHQADQM